MSPTPTVPRARRRGSRPPARRTRRAPLTLALLGAILTRPPRAVHRTMVRGANSNGASGNQRGISHDGNRAAQRPGRRDSAARDGSRGVCDAEGPGCEAARSTRPRAAPKAR